MGGQKDSNLADQVKPWRHGYHAQPLLGLPEGPFIRRSSTPGGFWGIFNAAGWNVSQDYHSSADAAWQEFDLRHGPFSRSQPEALFTKILRAGGSTEL